MARKKKTTKGAARVQVKPAGPRVRALVRAWDPKNRMQLGASLMLEDGGRVDLKIEAYGGLSSGFSGWSTYDARGKNTDAGHESISLWSRPQTKFKAAFMESVAPWRFATLQPETVTIKDTKSTLGAKALRQLAVAAFCEAFAAPVPDAAALRRQGRTKGAEKSAIKEQLIAELVSGKRGVDAWNNRSTPGWAALAKDLDFGARKLDGAKVDGVNFDRVALARSSLRKASLRKSGLERCNLADASAGGADFSDSEGYGTNFAKADLAGALFRKARLTYAKFQNATLVGADLRDADLEHADFRKANLTDARLGAELTFADLTDAILVGADLAGADLANTTLHGADLSAADLSRATLAIVGDDYELGTRWDIYKGARYDARTRFPKGYQPPATLLRVQRGRAPERRPGRKAKGASSFVDGLKKETDASRLTSALAMLKADRFQLYADVGDDGLIGIVKSQTDASLVYACRLTRSGGFSCCTQKLNACGGLRGALCKHLLVLTIGLVTSKKLAASAAAAWVRQSRAQSPSLDRDAVADVLLKYKGAESGAIDWRPTETLPEDYYAF